MLQPFNAKLFKTTGKRIVVPHIMMATFQVNLQEVARFALNQPKEESQQIFVL